MGLYRLWLGSNKRMIYKSRRIGVTYLGKSQGKNTLFLLGDSYFLLRFAFQTIFLFGA